MLVSCVNHDLLANFGLFNSVTLFLDRIINVSKTLEF